MKRGQSIIEGRHQAGVAAILNTLSGMRIVSARLHPENPGADPIRQRARHSLQRLRKSVVVWIHHTGGRRVVRHGQDAIERVERGLRGCIHEAEMRTVYRNV